MNGHKFISLFAGCGGSSLGYKWAGFKELLAIDFTKEAVKTFKRNFEAPIWNEDVTKVTGERILKEIGLKKGQLDLLDGSPPCQGFSTSGKRRVTDPRNNLFYDFTRLVKEIQPKVFIMENVPGQAKGKMKGMFKEIMKELKSTGYRVKAKQLNAANYGVPQARERIFYIGIRPDLDIEPVFPKPIGKPITVSQAFKDLGENEEFVTSSIPSVVASRLPFMKPGESASKYYYKNAFFSYVRTYWNKPSLTITKTVSTLHPFLNRFLTIKEVKRLCSFPDDFILTGSTRKQWGQLGNAVMPLQMQAIAYTIKTEVLDRTHGKN